MSGARRIVLARSISGAPVAADFREESCEIPAPKAEELLVRVLFLSLDPYIGSILRGRHLGETPPGRGDVAPGRAVCEVLESRSVAFRPGDIVAAETGWRTHAAVAAAAARKLDPAVAPLSAHLGVAGMPGLTAWAGLSRLAKLREGDVVLVSSAAGAVGGAAGQIARILGASQVIGIAGSEEKRRLVVGAYRFDACLDYRAADFRMRLGELLPNGADIYFDNVGGDVLLAALERLALYGRVVLCGLASQYQADQRPAGPNPGLFIAKRAQVFGLVVYDFAAEQDEYARRAAEWIGAGRLVVKEDRAVGLAAAPAHFEKLIRGENIGKAVVVVAEEMR